MLPILKRNETGEVNAKRTGLLLTPPQEVLGVVRRTPGYKHLVEVPLSDGVNLFRTVEMMMQKSPFKVRDERGIEFLTAEYGYVAFGRVIDYSTEGGEVDIQPAYMRVQSSGTGLGIYFWDPGAEKLVRRVDPTSPLSTEPSQEILELWYEYGPQFHAGGAWATPDYGIARSLER